MICREIIYILNIGRSGYQESTILLKFFLGIFTLVLQCLHNKKKYTNYFK